MSWGITGVLALVVLWIVIAEIRCGRRTKIFHQVIDPQIDALKSSVTAKYREKYGKDPTAPYPLIDLKKP